MSWNETVREAAFARTVLTRRPFDVFLQVTNRCNMKCSFCDFWPNGAAPSEELSLSDFARIERELAAMGRFIVSIEGGEPFLRPDLVEIVRIFGRRHVAVLYTNGWHVTERNARELFDAGLTQVGVSIDFPDERHDRKRGLPGALEKAWQSVSILRDRAPHGGKQVHVMTVLMKENAQDIEALLQSSAGRGVGHVVTLLATEGYRRGKVDALPEPGIGDPLVALWKRYRHWRFFGEYLEHMDDFLSGRPMPICRAGLQTFNIDHVGNVALCIEKIDRPVGNVRETPLTELHGRLLERRDEAAACQQCWTVCRAMGQHLGAGGNLRAWSDLALRMRSR